MVDKPNVPSELQGQHDNELTRRQALEKLAKLSIYSAPTVTALMQPQVSYAMGSAIPGNMTDNPGQCTWGGVHPNALGANNPANVVGGDANNSPNPNAGYNTPNGWVHANHDGYPGTNMNAAGSDQAKYNQYAWSGDTAADCSE